MPSSAHAFAYIRDLLFSRVAIVLDAEKDYLIESRMQPLLRKYSLEDLDALVVRLRQAAGDDLYMEVVDALTVNETYFFRDPDLFETMVKVVLPNLMEARKKQRRLQIWSAACSTGQEPYSLAMKIREQLPELASWRLHLLATDVSTTCLSRAKTGAYRKHEVDRGLSEQYLAQYFARNGADYEMNEDVRSMVEFRQINLIGDWPENLAPDLILMRNVLIYFNLETKKKILERARQIMAPDGFLMLGTAETTLNVDLNFERTYPGTYRLKNAGTDAPTGTGNEYRHSRY